MPCSDGLAQDRDDQDRARAALIAKVNRLTNLLCQAGRAAYHGTDIPDDVMAWWVAHRCRDAAAGRPW